MYAPKTVIIHIGINNLLNDSGNSNVENILNNFNVIIKKCRNYNVRNILSWYASLSRQPTFTSFW